ncbi:hypothetical protein D9M71_538200 [compost metagenome]
MLNRRSASCISATLHKPFSHERMRKIAVLRRSVKAQPITLSPTRARPAPLRSNVITINSTAAICSACVASSCSFTAKAISPCYAAPASCKWQITPCRGSTINGWSARRDIRGSRVRSWLRTAGPGAITISSRPFPGRRYFVPLWTRPGRASPAFSLHGSVVRPDSTRHRMIKVVCR